MKFAFQDETGEIYDVEAPEGTDPAYVLKQAQEEAGRPLEPFVAGLKEASRVVEKMLESEREGHGLTRAERDRYREQMEGFTRERDSERSGHERELAKASAGRLEAISQGREAGAKLYAAEQALQAARDECAALREKCADLRAQLKEARIPAPKHQGWTITPQRNAEGFARAYDVEPK